MGEVDGLGGFGLHPEGEFVGANAGIQLRLLGARLSVTIVDLAEEVELAALAIRTDLVGRGQVGDHLGAGSELGPLVSGRHETGPHQFLGPPATMLGRSRRTT